MANNALRCSTYSPLARIRAGALLQVDGISPCAADPAAVAQGAVLLQPCSCLGKEFVLVPRMDLWRLSLAGLLRILVRDRLSATIQIRVAASLQRHYFSGKLRRFIFRSSAEADRHGRRCVLVGDEVDYPYGIVLAPIAAGHKFA